MLQENMFLRSNKWIKDGKEHLYYTVVGSRRLRSGKVAQRQVIYLGEINDSQQAAWRKMLEVFDEEQHRLGIGGASEKSSLTENLKSCKGPDSGRPNAKIANARVLEVTCLCEMSSLGRRSS